jgi:DNA-binding NarL/FixJ family response regulator
MARVLVVDDQILIRAGLAALIQATPGLEAVGQAATGDEAVRMAAQTRPDVVLMDIRMPGISGIAAARQIIEASDNPPRILVLTTFDLDEYVYEALRAGASGFLLKDTPPERLLPAIRAAAEGDLPFAPTVVRRLVEAYARSPETAEPNGPDHLGALTNRETEVLRLVGTGLSNGEIAETLVVSEATVKTHLNRTMAKLDLSSRAQAVVLAYETGLVVPRRDGSVTRGFGRPGGDGVRG